MIRIVGALLALSWASAEPAHLPGFPVENNHPTSASGALVADLFGKNKPLIVITADESVLVLDGAGQPVRGFPVRLHDDAVDTEVSLHFNATPSACDLNGDGTQEIILAGSNSRLFALTAAGAPAPGFPVTLPGVARGPVACLPVGSGKAHDLLFTVDSGQLMRLDGGGGKPQTMAQIGEGAESGVAMGDLDGDGGTDLVVGGGDSKIYALGLSGQKREGFPYKMSFRATGVPALGDIDDDGHPDIVVGSEDYKIHAIDAHGKALPGFPVGTDYRLYAGVALADLDDNGVLDVVAASGDAKVYALDGHGKALAGFPVRLDGRLTSGVVVGDMDRDGYQDIALVSQAGTVHLLDAHGKERAGFPWKLKGKLESCPALADLDGEGHLDLVVQDKVGTVHAVRLPAVDSVPVAVAAWPVSGHDAAHTGRHFPNVARFKELRWQAPKPTTTETLQVAYRYFDLDADPEKDTQVRWYLADAHQADLDNHRQVPPERTSKHQVWRYTLQEGDNFRTYGDKSVLSQIATSEPVTIANTPPTEPGIALTPDAPLTTMALDVRVSRPSVDADGDAVTYRTLWLKDNKAQRWPLDTTHVDPRDTTKNEIWQVIMLAFDGEEEGARSVAQVSIRNTPPGAPALGFAPLTPRIDDPVQISIQAPAHDDDGDALTYRYRYWVNDAPLQLAEDGNRLPPRVLRKHQKVRVQAISIDDEGSGGDASVQFVVDNTPPPAPTLGIWPPGPRTRDDLRLVTQLQPVDADGDRIMLRHQWRVDGKPVEFPDVVPASATRKGQRWQVEGTPFDGEAVGPVSQIETVVLNTPPVAPVMVLDHYALYTDETVAPQVFVPATDDDDGDVPQLRYSWQRNGQALAELPASTASLDPRDTTKGERWTLTVTPFDGEAEGKPTHIPFSIINSPPGAPEIALSQHAPTVADVTTVSITKPAADRDDDKLVYHYRWYRDGVWQERWPLDQNSLQPGQARRDEHWRVDVRAFDGEAEGAPTLSELVIGNHAPAAPQVRVEPIPAHVTDDLRCAILAPGSDLDGDALHPRTQWWVDGQPFELPNDANRVPHALLHAGQRWECATAMHDGSLQSVWARSAVVTVDNTPPTAPGVVILPAMPQKRDDLVCGVQTPASDVDTDAVSYRFAWQVDGKPWSPATEPNQVPVPQRVPRSAIARGQNWECIVTPFDGKVEGPPGRAVATVQNTAPGAPLVGILPVRPIAGETLRCAILNAARDVDDDTITYQYMWYRDGIVQTFAPTSAEVPGRLVHRRDLWSCTAVARDKQAQSKPATSPDVAVTEAVSP